MLPLHRIWHEPSHSRADTRKEKKEATYNNPRTHWCWSLPTALTTITLQYEKARTHHLMMRLGGKDRENNSPKEEWDEKEGRSICLSSPSLVSLSSSSLIVISHTRWWWTSPVFFFFDTSYYHSVDHPLPLLSIPSLHFRRRNPTTAKPNPQVWCPAISLHNQKRWRLTFVNVSRTTKKELALTYPVNMSLSQMTSMQAYRHTHPVTGSHCDKLERVQWSEKTRW